MKKYIIALLTLLVLSGCGVKVNLKTYYDTMQVGENKINGYSVDLRLFGNYQERTVYDIVRIDNYQNEEFQITDSNRELKTNENGETFDSSLYFVNDKVYESSDGTTFTESLETSIYTNPNIYLTSLENALEVSNSLKEKVGGVEYTAYSYKTPIDTMKKIMEYTTLKDINFTSDIETKVYLNKNNQVYKISYYLNTGLEQSEKLELSVCFFGINVARKTVIPTES